MIKIGLFTIDGVLVQEKEISETELAQMIKENDKYWFSEESKNSNQD